MRPILGAILSVSSLTLNDEEKRLFERYNPLGVALFGRNLNDIEQVKALIKNIKETIGRDDVLIALDQEGGRVDRLKQIRGHKLASQSILGKIGSCQMIKNHVQIVASEMQNIGANFNFAPVLDLDYKNTTLALKSRSFSSGAKKVSNLGKVMWKAYVKEGVCPCMKHLPGHGRAQNDPHLGLPMIEEDLKTLERDFFPFRENKDCPAAMTAHILLKNIDDRAPITFSKKGVKEIIRGLLDYQGFLISDALEMGALKGSVAERVQKAIDAGLDAVCYCMGDISGLKAVCESAGFLPDKSLERFEKTQNVLKTHRPQTNIDLLKEKYYAKVNLFGQEKIDYDATEVLFQLNNRRKEC